jgi:hypothetical protein
MNQDIGLAIHLQSLPVDPGVYSDMITETIQPFEYVTGVDDPQA